ncbi:single-strand binding protein [Alicyclobacillus hesperidum]|uniref:Single-stranded DNA-binding protein n=1 Tax=Alicyclobacillus hesperidum TaxID=89784 RepID=A0A1H2XYL6_9BACL|nr:single-stranded DNA-binding protein [Alicyclobacillus hesperidum]SDW97534.1 single-strand binding protein [Alicyclobacillus hesperidum]
MLNRVILIGRLTADPELRYTNNGTAVTSFTLAVDRMRSNANGERQTDFINIVVWQKQAEVVAQYLQKGRMAAVDGRLQIRTYENRDGQKVRVAEVVAEGVRFLDRGEGGNSAKSAPTAPSAKNSPPSAPSKRQDFDPYDDPFADDLPPEFDEELPF